MTAPARTRTVGDRLAEDLRAAAQLLQQDGWIRQGFHSPAGHDITGALMVVTGYHRRDEHGVWRAHPMEQSAYRRVNETRMWLLRRVPAATLGDFNDEHCLNLATAVDLLQRAADDAERQLRDPRSVERWLS